VVQARGDRREVLARVAVARVGAAGDVAGDVTGRSDFCVESLVSPVAVESDFWAGRFVRSDRLF
jgi:hypothetical protein